MSGCRLDGLTKDVMPLPLVVHVALDAMLILMIQRTILQRLNASRSFFAVLACLMLYRW